MTVICAVTIGKVVLAQAMGMAVHNLTFVIIAIGEGEGAAHFRNSFAHLSLVTIVIGKQEHSCAMGQTVPHLSLIAIITFKNQNAIAVGEPPFTAASHLTIVGAVGLGTGALPGIVEGADVGAISPRGAAIGHDGQDLGMNGLSLQRDRGSRETQNGKAQGQI